MGNCSLKGVTGVCHNSIRVLTDSGAVLDFKGPIKARDILNDHPGYGIFRQGQASSPLQDLECLISGRLYYLLPLSKEHKLCKNGVTEQVQNIGIIEQLEAEWMSVVEPAKMSSYAASDFVDNLANGSALEVLPTVFSSFFLRGDELLQLHQTISSTADSTDQPKELSLIDDPKERRLKMIAGAFYIAKTKVNSTAEGDDAYFICREKQTIGVADGVGGWAKLGVDPGEYARQLMINSLKAILMEPEGKINLKRVLNQAFLDSNAIGSSTACIINLKDHCLHVANVGDSGFMLIRKRGGIYKSEIQQRSFNHPFQLGKLNADVLDSVQSNIRLM
nr:putative protein phosphatase 2c 55 [Quercus suber]